MFKIAITTFLLVFSIGTMIAQAQSKNERQLLREKRATEVRLTVRYNLSYPVEDTSPDNIQKMQEKGRRAFYQMIAKECQLLLETIAAECRIGIASVNNQRPRNNKPQTKVITTGSATFHLQMKAGK